MARKPSGCPECAETVKGMANSLVASAFGDEQITALQATPLALVAGGADGFQRTVEGMGVRKPEARKMARMLERQAADTLTGPGAPALPKGFETYARRVAA